MSGKVREDLTKITVQDFEKFRQQFLKKDVTSLLISQLNNVGGFGGMSGGSSFQKKENQEIQADFELEPENNYQRIFLVDRDNRQIKDFEKGKVEVSPTYGVRLQRPLKKEIKGEEDYLDAIEEINNFGGNPLDMEKDEESQQDPTDNSNIFLPNL